MALEDQIISILKKSPADQYLLYRQVDSASMSEITKIIAKLHQKKIIHVAKYRKSERTGLDIPVYSLSPSKRDTLDIQSLLAGVTSERLVEYRFIAKSLANNLKRACILDVGAAKSGLALTISEFRSGWQVLGIDLALGSDAIMDARSLGFRDNAFDQVISISTVEHIALDDMIGDIKAMQEILRVLKKDGSAIISVPYGKGNRLDHRVYDRKSLTRLTSLFKVVKKEFYRFDAGKWIKCSQDAADKADPQLPLHLHSAVCACLLLRKQ